MGMFSRLSSGSFAPARVRRGRAGVSPPADADEEPPPLLQPELALPANEPIAAQWPEDSRSDAPGPNWPLVFLFFLALAVVQTFPLALHRAGHDRSSQLDHRVTCDLSAEICIKIPFVSVVIP
jgi:hypothetical protein